MSNHPASEQAKLRQLFYSFVDAGLHGRFTQALALIDEPYVGVGMGEQGIVKSKAEAALILQGSYRSEENASIELEIAQLTIHFITQEVAVLTGEVTVSNTPPGGKPLLSGLMQTIGAHQTQDGWKIVFTHSSPSVLTANSVDAYPLRFLDKTLSTLKADLQAAGGAQLDSLTSILNRDGFDRQVAQRMADYNPQHNTALFMMDLDDFKQINDRLGHPTGDIVLRQVAQTLRRTFRDSDIVGRIGGDEFMVFLSGNFTSKFLENKADTLLNTLQVHVGDTQQVPVSVSIGIAYGRARVTFEKLYRIADISLYTAKKAGKCRYHLINSDTNAQRSYRGSGANLLSLQALLEYTDGKDLTPSKTPYEALLENIPGGVAMYEFTDTTIKVTHCNEWFSRLLGYTPQELQAMEAQDPLAFIHPEDLSIMQQAVLSIRAGADSNQVVYRVCHKDGRSSYINQTTTVTERRPGSIILYGIKSALAGPPDPT